MAADDKKRKKSGDDSGGSMKMVLVYVGSMAVMTIVAIVLVVMVIGPKMAPAPMLSQEQKSQRSQAMGDPRGLASHVIPLGEFIVNPAGSNGLRYLSVDLSAAVTDSSTSALVSRHQAELSHTIVSVVSAKTIEELEKAGGMEELGTVIKEGLNEVFGEGRFQRIFFTRFIIQ